ncbi:hypothetical protein SAV14893_020930 [Streptomyces avermitilis]|uniref:Uncharacterized protein n=1 Tax=Streptomyces avermitilis TaxID=33903 RepID=A0A4D4LTC6_STRAX|nr:hypothetical protein SAV14893_020930 [Streptomyces avermitilis]
MTVLLGEGHDEEVDGAQGQADARRDDDGLHERAPTPGPAPGARRRLRRGRPYARHDGRQREREGSGPHQQGAQRDPGGRRRAPDDHADQQRPGDEEDLLRDAVQTVRPLQQQFVLDDFAPDGTHRGA